MDSNIFDVANTLFEDQGFEQTSLQDIAEQANLSLEALLQEFNSKEKIALGIYHALAETALAERANLEKGTISERYFAMLEQKLVQLKDHEEAVSALFATAMRPKSMITAADISPGLKDPMMQVIQTIIDDASDKPSRDDSELALFLYAFHFLVIIFWLYDRTKSKEASQLFIRFLRDFVKLLRPMMVMPMVSKAMSKIAKIMMVVFGGARIVDSEPSDSSD